MHAPYPGCLMSIHSPVLKISQKRLFLFKLNPIKSTPATQSIRSNSYNWFNPMKSFSFYFIPISLTQHFCTPGAALYTLLSPFFNVGLFHFALKVVLSHLQWLKSFNFKALCKPGFGKGYPEPLGLAKLICTSDYIFINSVKYFLVLKVSSFSTV